MTVIHADPAEFRRVAGDLRRIVQAVRQDGRGLIQVTAGVPSYDGQWAPWVQAIAAEGERQGRAFAERLETLAHTLDRYAEGFEQADTLRERGYPALAGQIENLVEEGLEQVAFPWWLVRPQRPPGISPNLWNRLPQDDKDAILRELGGTWAGFLRTGNYANARDQDVWSAFLVYLATQGPLGASPSQQVWVEGARATGMSLEAYIAHMTGIDQTHVEAWLRAADTHQFRRDDPLSEMAGMARADETVEGHFGVTMDGNWSDADTAAMLEGVLFLAYGMARVTGSKFAGSTFRDFFGDVTFRLEGSGPANVGCQRAGFGFTCQPGTRDDMSPQLAIHELGHVFNATISNHLDVADHPERAALRPYEMLGRATLVDDNGNHVTGDQWPNGFTRTDLGYVLVNGRRFPWQQHPLTMGGGNTPGEDFADMVLNWAMNSFDYSEEALGAGRARYNWMEERMANWIAYGTEPFDESWLNPP